MIRKLLKSRRNKPGMVSVMDISGKWILIPDRRRRRRSPFSGKPALKKPEFDQLRAFIASTIGINIPENDIRLMEARLTSRLRTLNIPGFEDYVGYLFSHRGVNQELDSFIDAVTTGKTHFWREHDHFDFLLQKGIRKLLAHRERISAWSVGCSTGEEPYSLAMCLEEHARKHKSFEYTVLGTDISTLALMNARKAVYDKNSIKELPEDMRQSYMIQHGSSYSVRQSIHDRVRFQRLNLLDDSYAFNHPVDIAMFRNVGIYFDAANQQAVVSRICDQITEGGYLCIGHSENIADIEVPFKEIADKVYMKC